MLYMAEPDPNLVFDLRDALERRELAAASYEEAMEDLATALRGARQAGAPITLLADYTGLSRPTIYRLLKTGGVGYERRLLGGAHSSREVGAT